MLSFGGEAVKFLRSRCQALSGLGVKTKRNIRGYAGKGFSVHDMGKSSAGCHYTLTRNGAIVARSRKIFMPDGVNKLGSSGAVRVGFDLAKIEAILSKESLSRGDNNAI